MNATDHDLAERSPKLAITDSMALYALREGGDEAACAWLELKYRPLVTHIAKCAFAGVPMPAEVVDECLRRAIALLKSDLPAVSAVGVFACTALQVSCEWARRPTSPVGESDSAA